MIGTGSSTKETPMTIPYLVPDVFIIGKASSTKRNADDDTVPGFTGPGGGQGC